MWHSLESIAEGRLLDTVAFTTFVKEHCVHYLDRFDMLNTMEIECIVQAYRDSMPPEVLEEHRRRIIQEKMKSLNNS